MSIYKGLQKTIVQGIIGADLVYVGENESSSICKVADLFLKVKIEKEPDAYNMLATASTLAVISLFDAIAIYLEKNTSFSQEVFLVNHPSGEVGDRLNKNVGKQLESKILIILTQRRQI